MKFNINDDVKVKLTETGREILREQHEELRGLWPTFPGYEEPKEDKDGWTTYQMWCLMESFGQHVAMGLTMPFETTIEIPEVET